jgi:hypothetical protein
MTVADDAPRPDRVEAVEVILKIGGEGGSLTIEGVKAAHGWRFRAIRNEYALMDFLRGEDGFEFWSGSGWVDSFDRALALFDRYPWHRLYPLQVHSDFKARIWAAVQERYDKDRDGDPAHLERSSDRWRQLCAGTGDRAGELTSSSYPIAPN